MDGITILVQLWIQVAWRHLACVSQTPSHSALMPRGMSFSGVGESLASAFPRYTRIELATQHQSKPGALSLSPKIHVKVEGENHPHTVALHTHTHARTHAGRQAEG